jgi:hypothetical protein
VGDPARPDGQRAAGHESGGEGAERGGRRPAPFPALDERERQRTGRAGEQRGAGQVGRRRLPRVRLAEPAEAEHHGRDADRDVDEEDQPPAPGLDQQTAQRGAERGGDGADRAPRGDRGCPLLRRERGEQQAERGRDHRRRGRALDGPGGHERARRAGDRTGGRREREDADADQVDPPPPDAVGGAAEDHEQRREGQRIAVDDPGQRAEAGVEVADDLGERDVDDRHVEVREERAEGGDPERGPRAGAVARRVCGGQAVGRGAGELGHVGELLGRWEHERSCEVLSKNERSC